MQIKRTALFFLLLALASAGVAATLFITQQSSTPLPQPSRLPTSQEALSITPSSALGSPVKIRLAWYYNKPRSETDMAQIVAWYDLFILIQGDDKARAEMVSRGAKGPILQYFEFESIHDPGSCDAEPKLNQVAYLPGDFCTISEEHPDWFLLDQNGDRIIVTEGDARWALMDPAQPGWQAFFVDRIRRSQKTANWDGVFLDNVPVTLAFREDDNQIPAAYPDDASYQAAIQNFLAYMQRNYFKPNQKLLFANLVSRRDDARWTEYLTSLDGVMHEGWAIDWPDGYRPADVWEKHLRLAEETQAMGKTIILVSQGTRDDFELQRFSFASYLLVNNGNAVFRYANSDKYREVWLYDNYSFDLGQPLGPRYRDGSGWRRDYANGTVFVDPEKHISEILLNE